MRARGRAAKLGLLATLYLSQGLPFGFFSQALPVLLRERGATLSVVGLSSLLALPWALKFLFSGQADRYAGVWFGRRMGRRRGWILPLQGALVLLFVGASWAGEGAAMVVLLALSFVANAIGAAQDTAADGLAVELLTPRERGLGNGVQVAGYRVGMILGGGGLLVVAARAGWRLAFLTAASVLLAASIPIARYEEPAEPPCADATSSGWLNSLRSPGMASWMLAAGAYKFGDAAASAMVRPLLVDLGLGLESVGRLLGIGGFTAGLAGALAGGWATGRFGTRHALLVFGLAQAVSIAGYAALHSDSPSSRLWTVCSIEHFCGGMATAALFTAMMDRTRRTHASADYTLQACAVVCSSGIAASLSGFATEIVGYSSLFLYSALLSAMAAVWAARRPEATHRVS